MRPQGLPAAGGAPPSRRFGRCETRATVAVLPSVLFLQSTWGEAATRSPRLTTRVAAPCCITRLCMTPSRSGTALVERPQRAGNVLQVRRGASARAMLVTKRRERRGIGRNASDERECAFRSWPSTQTSDGRLSCSRGHDYGNALCANRFRAGPSRDAPSKPLSDPQTTLTLAFVAPDKKQCRARCAWASVRSSRQGKANCRESEGKTRGRVSVDATTSVALWVTSP